MYRTTINGQEEDVNLPFRALVLGDFSLGSSKDRKADLEDRKARTLDGSNLNELMKAMEMSIEFDVDDKTTPGVEGKLQVKLPVENMKSFHPDQIIQHVPRLKALVLLRKLLLEMQSDIENRKDLWRTLNEIYANSEERKKLLEGAALKDLAPLRLPSGAAEAPPAEGKAPPKSTKK